MRAKKLKKLSSAVLSLLCAAAVFVGICDAAIPDRIAARAGDMAALSEVFGDEAVAALASERNGNIFRKSCSAGLFGVIPIKSVDVTVIDDVNLIPGGVPFGVKLYSNGVVVVGVGDVTCGTNSVSPARDAGFMERDIIRALNGKAVSEAAEISELVSASEGKPIEFTVKRGDKELTINVTPVISSSDGKYKTGLLIRDSTAGIGTVTYIDPEIGSFAGLGHGICDTDTGELVELTRGTVVNVAISDVVKGQPGIPGELKGYFSSGKIGTIFGNNDCGVYGIFSEYPSGVGNECLPIALSSEIKEGEAELWCTTDGGGVGKYKVNISNIDHSGRNVKNFVVTVTDPTLLECTGGIVQGMSGSPLIQNGKLIGAVTHVLINDPTKGYGIFIENMLASAG
ncbi:MAG: SpoIVB peptidase [Clostridia bacterium]|nr:SpoIVB peptidase [Clostridia bacterium]